MQLKNGCTDKLSALSKAHLLRIQYLHLPLMKAGFWGLLSLILTFGPMQGSAQASYLYSSPSEAFTAADSSSKPVLLVFSGSDWCAPCIRFEREVLMDSAFIGYAHDHVVILKADFPQRKKIDPELVKAYEGLADRYNQEGAFPKVILLGNQGKGEKVLKTIAQTPKAFIRQLQQELH